MLPVGNVVGRGGWPIGDHEHCGLWLDMIGTAHRPGTKRLAVKIGRGVGTGGIGAGGTTIALVSF